MRGATIKIDDKLNAIVGGNEGTLPYGEFLKRLWTYIKANNLLCNKKVQS